MAGSEPVTSPDQHKPTNRKAAYTGAVLTAAALVTMMFCNNEVNGIAKLWLVGLAAALLAIVAGDAILRRSGLRP